jgi:uncharacterized protein (DUF697 family)
MRLPVSVGALRGLLKELQVSAGNEKPLVVGGARELARVLARELARGGSPSSVRVGDPAGGALYVHIVGDGDDSDLKRARRARVPIIAIVLGEEDVAVPFVLATDVVRVEAGRSFPVGEIVARIAARLGEDAAPLAGRLPVLRPPVCDRRVESFARKNGIVGAAVFVPGADLPVLALNQVRMLLRLDQAYGLELDPRERLPEIAATIGAGMGMRAVARELLDLVRVRHWRVALVKGAVAYAGTKALGEAAIRRLQASASGGVP